VSAHAAIHKAAEYFNIKLILIGTDRHGRLSLSELKQKMNRNVILVYASAPGYPHGIIDPVEDIAKCVSSWGCCLHVDACLGGFLLPFINDSQVHGTKKIKYGFEIPAVTSMSVDTHKYGCAHKGSSVVLYRSRSIRKFQYTAVTSWTGGMYISPSQPGSRSGGLVAQTWAALNYFGHDGYAKMAQSIVEASLLLRKRILNIPQLELIGEDVTMIVAWKSKDKGIDIYVINDLLTDMGWHLSVLHSPPALHFCITSANVDSIDLLIDDLLKAMKCAKSGKHNSKNSRAPIYGMANKMSNTSIVDDLLKDVQDSIDQS
jgi:sphinganine-1-phosphate aldolase|tara:strand:- start:6817 stop:7767 length:951 start_codon:yes stop_codon:yes gene_type:complete